MPTVINEDNAEHIISLEPPSKSNRERDADKRQSSNRIGKDTNCMIQNTYGIAASNRNSSRVNIND